MKNESLRPLLVKASAGTGKTFQLSNRLLSLLIAGEKPERILATTFTRKAAGEINHRVISRLARACTSDDEAKSLGTFVGHPDLTTQRAMEILTELLRFQHRLSVCTLDSFCIQIALCFAVEIGLDPNWTIIDEAVSDELVEEALTGLFEDLSHEELLGLLRGLGKGQTHRSTFARLKREITSLYGLYRVTPDEAWDSFAVPTKLNPDEIEVAVNLLKSQDLPKTKAGKPNSRWKSALEKAVFDVRSGNWDRFLQSGIPPRVISGGDYYGLETPPAMRASFLPLIEHAKSFILGELRERNLAAVRMLSRYHSFYSQVKSSRNAIEFSDVKELLASASVMGDLQQVYFRIDSRISHLLLDEFQDTSLLEWQVISPVVEEILSSEDGQRSFFCVGDVKQAIYGWRGGVAEIFSHLEARWPELNSERLDTSYRSADEIMQFVNVVFHDPGSNAALSSYQHAAQEWASDFHEHTTAVSEGGYVEVVECERISDDAFAFDNTLEYTVSKVSELTENGRQITVGVLVRKNREIGETIAALRQRGIDASGEGGSSLDSSPLVRLILSLLTLIDHPSDGIARYHVENTGLLSLLWDRNSEDPLDDFLNRERSRICSLGIGTVVSKWTARLEAGADLFDAVRLSKLVDLSFSHEAQIGTRLDRLVSLLTRARAEDRTASRVKVMTIHQSKGLEFDAVILPTLEDKFLSSTWDPAVSWAPSAFDAPVMASVYPSTLARILEPKLENMYLQKQDAKMVEALSLFYVALTRARRALYAPLSGAESLKSFPVSPAGFLRALFRDKPQASPGEVLFTNGDPLWYRSLPRCERTEEIFNDHSTEIPPSFEAQAIPQRVNPSRKNELKTGGEIIRSGTAREVYAKMKGTFLHAILEQIEWIDPGTCVEDVLKAISIPARGKIPLRPSQLSDSYDDLIAFLSTECGASLFDRDSYARQGVCLLKVFREFPYSLKNGVQLFRGTVDRLVLGYREDGSAVFADIIDFKSDRVEAGVDSTPDLLISRYSEQLFQYRNAIQQCFSLDPDSITSRLAFISLGKVFEV